jgi:TonB family protein
MRPNFSAIAILAASVFAMQLDATASEGEGPGTLQDMLDYASEFSQNGDSLRAIIVYDLMLRAFSTTGNTENLRAICHDLALNIPPEDVTHFNRAFWKCTEEQLVGWLGDIEEYRRRDAYPLVSFAPYYGDDTPVSEGSVTLFYDVSPKGKAENIKVMESTHPDLEGPAVEIMKKWIFAPALFEGEPEWALGKKIKFTLGQGDS